MGNKLSLLDLPPDLILHVFKQLEVIHRPSLALTCKHLARVAEYNGALVVNFIRDRYILGIPPVLFTYEHCIIDWEKSNGPKKPLRTIVILWNHRSSRNLYGYREKDHPMVADVLARRMRAMEFVVQSRGVRRLLEYEIIRRSLDMRPLEPPPYLPVCEWLIGLSAEKEALAIAEFEEWLTSQMKRVDRDCQTASLARIMWWSFKDKARRTWRL